MKLVVTASELRYAGKRMLKGEEFEATDKHGKLLVAIRKAQAAPSAETDQAAARPASRKPAGRGGRMMFPDQPKTDDGGGTYGRRDMRAQD